MTTSDIQITLPEELREHVNRRVAEGGFGGPGAYVQALIRAERAYQEKRADLLRALDAGLADLEAERLFDGEEVFAELLGERTPSR